MTFRDSIMTRAKKTQVKMTNREPMTISLGVRKVEKLLQRDRDFSRRIEIMEMNLREKSKKKYFFTIA